jgi:hypothetical protein
MVLGVGALTHLPSRKLYFPSGRYFHELKDIWGVRRTCTTGAGVGVLNPERFELATDSVSKSTVRRLLLRREERDDIDERLDFTLAGITPTGM